MWHVDEGALHAYLDGALDEFPAAEARKVREHLESCRACADRLADERRVRERAGEILGLAAPEVEVPTFEELRAYVRRSQPTGGAGVSGRLHRVGWAASVVLALGTGWLLRGGGVPATTLREMGDGVGSTSVSALGADAGQEVRAPASVAAAESEVSLGAQRNETVAASEPPAEPRGVAPTSGSGARTLASAARADDRPGTADADPSLDVGSTGPVASDLVAAAPGVVAPTSVGSAGAAPSSPASAPVTSVADAQKAAENQAAARDANAAPARRAAPEQRLTSAITAEPALAAGVRARQAAPADADAGVAADEAVSLVVPGLEVLDVLPVGQGTTFAGMRALQRLEGGDTLELVHLPESVDPASLPPLRVGWSELVRERGAGWIVMRARLPQATLVELLQRLESGR